MSKVQVCWSRGNRERCMGQAHVMEILEHDNYYCFIDIIVMINIIIIIKLCVFCLT